jgi:hypothetical protein
MRALLIAAVVALGFAPQVPSLAQAPIQAPAPQGPKVQVTFEPNGLVTLVANNATLREILTEWSRQGGSTFVNSERLTGAPQTLQYEHQSETVVMSSILRQAAGFMLGPRREGTRGASSLEVVYILPTSNPSAGGYMSQPAMPQPQQQVTTQGNPDDELAPVNGRGAPGPQPAQAPPPPPSNDYRPAVPSVAVPIVAQPPTSSTTPPATTTTPPATTTGRGGGAAGAGGSK